MWTVRDLNPQPFNHWTTRSTNRAAAFKLIKIKRRQQEGPKKKKKRENLKIYLRRLIRSTGEEGFTTCTAVHHQGACWWGSGGLVTQLQNCAKLSREESYCASLEEFHGGIHFFSWRSSVFTRWKFLGSTGLRNRILRAHDAAPDVENHFLACG